MAGSSNKKQKNGKRGRSASSSRSSAVTTKDVKKMIDKALPLKTFVNHLTMSSTQAEFYHDFQAMHSCWWYTYPSLLQSIPQCISGIAQANQRLSDEVYVDKLRFKLELDALTDNDLNWANGGVGRQTATMFRLVLWKAARRFDKMYSALDPSEHEDNVNTQPQQAYLNAPPFMYPYRKVGPYHMPALDLFPTKTGTDGVWQPKQYEVGIGSGSMTDRWINANPLTQFIDEQKCTVILDKVFTLNAAGTQQGEGRFFEFEVPVGKKIQYFREHNGSTTNPAIIDLNSQDYYNLSVACVQGGNATYHRQNLCPRGGASDEIGRFQARVAIDFRDAGVGTHGY